MIISLFREAVKSDEVPFGYYALFRQTISEFLLSTTPLQARIHFDLHHWAGVLNVHFSRIKFSDMP